MSIHIPESVKRITITDCRTNRDICGERIAEKYLIRGQDTDFEKYKNLSKLRYFLDISIIGVCTRCFNRGGSKPKTKIPFFIRKLQCRKCLLKEHVACSVWGGIAPPLWTVYLSGLHLCGSFVRCEKDEER